MVTTPHNPEHLAAAAKLLGADAIVRLDNPRAWATLLINGEGPRVIGSDWDLIGAIRKALHETYPLIHAVYSKLGTALEGMRDVQSDEWELLADSTTELDAYFAACVHAMEVRDGD